MKLNTYWTLAYAELALDAHDPIIAGIAFDIAVSGGIVFG